MRKAAFAALLLAATAAPPAGAQEEGVFLDPDTPAGKEYALPLDQARREAAPHGSGGEGGDGGSGQPLFGVGIDRLQAAREDEGSSSADTGDEGTGAEGRTTQPAQGSGRGQGRSGGGSSSAGDLGPSAGSSAALEATANGGSDVLLTAGLAAAVLGAGLLGGLGLRRLLRAG